MVFHLNQVSWHFQGCIVCRLQRDIGSCADRPKGTDQYVTVNVRLADAAAQGLQSINCRLKAHGEQRMLSLLFSHIVRKWIANVGKLIGTILDLWKEWKCIAIWPVDIGVCAFQAGSNCKSQPIYSAHTRTHTSAKDGGEELSRSMRNERWDTVTRS